MKKTIIGALLASSLLISTQAAGHGRYILPSHTVLSGEKPETVTLMASISNDFFHPDRPLGDDGKGKVDKFLQGMFKHLQMSKISPDGQQNDLTWRAYARQSVADLELTQSGTYRVSLVQPDTPVVTFKNAEGSRDRVFGFETPLPEGATQVKKRTFSSRVEAWISRNEPNRKAVEPVGKGLELAGESHPNDLFVGEENQFQLFFDGQPLTKEVALNFTLGGTRHRNLREPVNVTTDKSGKFTVTFEKAGFYLMEASYAQSGRKDSGIDMHHYGLYGTFEVFPE